jgi:hypothetical protein
MFSKGMVCVIVALFLSFRVGGLPVVALFYSLRHNHTNTSFGKPQTLKHKKQSHSTNQPSGKPSILECAHVQLSGMKYTYVQVSGIKYTYAQCFPDEWSVLLWMWFCVLEFEVCQRVSLCCCGSIFVFDSLRFTRGLVCDVGSNSKTQKQSHNHTNHSLPW